LIDVKRICDEGFIFSKIHLDWQETELWLDESLYDEKPVYREGYDVALRWDNISKNCMRPIINQVYSKLSSQASHLLFDMQWDAHLMKKGDYMSMHHDTGEGGLFQVLVWVCEHHAFKGREFVYGEEDHLMERKPENGLVCVMNTTNPKFIHGVNPLLTDTKIATITGFLP